MKNLTLQEVEQHKAVDNGGVWLVVDGLVYDVTSFVDEHPGGKKVLLSAAGTDASDKFWQFHNKSILDKVAKQFLIGQIGDGAQSAPSEEAPAPVAEAQDNNVDELDETYFGDLVPFGDPFWYQDWASPYYNDSHRAVRRAVREFTDTYLTPNAYDWDQAKEIPPAEYKRIADFGILCAIAAGANGWPEDQYSHGIPVPGNVDKDKWDAFHNLILIDELSRCASGGVLYGLLGGFGISIGPILLFGSEDLKGRLVGPLLRGEIRSCLAITEAEGGSDVANLTREAKKTSDGQHYIVNGAAKWITNGIYSEVFVTAVRTGGKGFGGISLLVVERKHGGLKTRKMECMGVIASGTSYVDFEDVKVPVDNLLGKENKGFQLIMHNFAGERAGIVIQANRFARVCLEESIKYASKRKTFGKLLIDHPVIRAKIANMGQRIESTHAWLESVVYQTTQYDPDTISLRGGGTMALLKAQATDTFEFCVREAAMIFGGLAYTKGGQAEKIERLYREALAYSLPGGAVDIMKDVSVRQNVKIAQIMGAKL
ncbi:uncharacterized protein JCM15063_003839 [Sporobolomyces koalae]|uniref:uncharacterized protein n=1 Tax=Sporobolomyces koalae TaxID=500713 RepID=UPI0031806BEC